LRTTLLLLLISLNSFGQQPFLFKNLRKIDGLPSDMVYQTAQDAQGYMWFATDRGVSRYDGYEFLNFTRKEGLTDDEVFGIFPEPNGRVWFYTYFGGLCYFENDSIHEPAFNKALKETLDSVENDIIVSLAVDKTGTVWIGLQSQFLIKIEPDGCILKLNAPPSSRSLLAVETEHLKGSSLVYNSGLYIKPLNKLLVVKNKTKDTLELDLESYKVKDLQWARVKLLQLRDTSYLVASENKVLTYDKYGRFLQKVSLKKDSHTLFALHEDTEGNIWVGTRAGVYRFQKGNLNQVQKFLLHHTVSSVTQDTEGGYWFTTLHDGVFYQPNFEIKSTSSFQPQKTRAIDMAVSDAAVCVGYSNKDLEVFKAGSFSNRKIYKDHFTNSIPLYTRQGQVMVSNYGGRHYTIKQRRGGHFLG
jgi:ligand-binding sensor domain-containing protein